jgi:DNA-binding NtrC family response regulator
MNLDVELTRIEVELIRRSLQTTHGNRLRAAQLLGLKRTTLLEKIKRLGLQQFTDELADASDSPSLVPPRHDG